mmetsp:Transcript_28489/g.53421  ORF Transcript_28489/g.53421 Transcript_28489/m.53421 type:complete len:203 (-) Transcript_28489:808-1416(-)
MCLAFCGALRVKSHTVVSANPCRVHQASSHILERRPTSRQLGIAADFVPPSAFVASRRWICSANLSQVAECVIWIWNICFTDPKLTLRILCAQIAAKRIKVFAIKASTNTQFCHHRSTSVLESCPTIRHFRSATMRPPSTAISVLRCSSGIFPQPTYFRPGCILLPSQAAFAHPELAISIVPAKFATHCIQFFVILATNVFQ